MGPASIRMGRGLHVSIKRGTKPGAQHPAPTAHLLTVRCVRSQHRSLSATGSCLCRCTAANTVRYFYHGEQALEPMARQRYVIDTPREGPFFFSVPSLASFIDSATIISQPAIPGPFLSLAHSTTHPPGSPSNDRHVAGTFVRECKPPQPLKQHKMFEKWPTGCLPDCVGDLLCVFYSCPALLFCPGAWMR